MSNKAIKVLIWIVCILFVLVMSLFSFAMYYMFAHRLEYKVPESVIAYPSAIDTHNYGSHSEIQKFAKDLVGVHCVSISEVASFKDPNVSGQCNVLTRRVEILAILNTNGYVETMVHELVHIKYVAKNERWVSFKTFQILWEAKCYDPITQFLQFQNWIDRGGDYDCLWYCQQYMRDHPC